MFAVVLPLVTLCSCGGDVPKQYTDAGTQPSIYPDYKGVAVPAGIAPLDFNIAGEPFESMAVEAVGEKGGSITASGSYADFDIDDWHELTERNRINVTVYVKRGGHWTRYKAFAINVSKYKLDDWGLTYRLIDPGYEVGGDIGIYQRELATFDESAVLTEKAVHPLHAAYSQIVLLA